MLCCEIYCHQVCVRIFLPCTSWVAILHEKLAGETFTRVLDFWRQLPVLRVRQFVAKNVWRSVLDGIRRSSFVSVVFTDVTSVRDACKVDS